MGQIGRNRIYRFAYLFFKVWDDNLALAAQAHADTCQYGHGKTVCFMNRTAATTLWSNDRYCDCFSDYNRGKGIGENIYMDKKNPVDMVQGWYDEVNLGSIDYNNMVWGYIGTMGHYTQVISKLF